MPRKQEIFHPDSTFIHCQQYVEVKHRGGQKAILISRPGSTSAAMNELGAIAIIAIAILIPHATAEAKRLL